LLDFESRFLLEDVKGAQAGGIRQCEKRLEAFNAAWARLQSDDPGWPIDEPDRLFQQVLIAWLRFHQAMLICELVPETLRYIRDNPASPFAGMFDHVLVDEYQDLNRAEQVLLDLLAEAGKLAVIGDEDQSIYSFKHAHPEGISTFHETHEGTAASDVARELGALGIKGVRKVRAGTLHSLCFSMRYGSVRPGTD
jgi:superfamily I DNA/RNA helicase